MEVGQIPVIVAWSPEGPTFTADLQGLHFEQGICGPIPAGLRQRAEWVGARVLDVVPTDSVAWEHSETGWTLKATPARADVPDPDMKRLLVFDPDDPPAELGHDFLAFLKLYDLRSGLRRKGKGQ
jgi:hypothetical protein